MKSKAAAIVGAIFMAVIVLFFVITGAGALMKGSPTAPRASTSKGTLCELDADFAMKAFEISNSINFIPIGKEHYYLMTAENDEDFVPFLVRAKPSWIEKHFDIEEDPDVEAGFAKSGSVKIKGVVSSINSEVRKEVSETSAQLAKLGVKVSSVLYIDARYKEFGILRILSGAAIAVLAVLSLLGAISGVLKSNKLLRVLLGIAALGVAALALFTLQVGF